MSSNSSSPTGGGRCSGRWCKTTWTCARHGRRRPPGSTALPWRGRTGSRGTGWRPATAGCWPRLFGTVQVTRCAWRRPGAGNLYPADAALSLPAPRHSHTLARLAALEAVRGSFETAHAAITSRCGPVMGKRQIEQAVVNAAGDIAAFYAARVPMPCTASTLLVISADSKGVVMRPGALRPATAKAAARRGRMRTRLAAGEKPNRKRMATLACVYDAEPAPRRPHDVIAPPGGRHGHRTLRPRPKARAKWLAGSVEHDPAEVIAAAFGQAEARDPARQRTWVILVDGAEHQLGLIRAEAARRGITISILIDLIHVLEYIWKAAWSLHTAGDPAAEDWVAVKALAVLAGDSARAAADITAEADAAGLTAAQRNGADTCVRYLTSKDEFLCYDQALAAGWPIATGVIEGACRHLVKDRMVFSSRDHVAFCPLRCQTVLVRYGPAAYRHPRAGVFRGGEPGLPGVPGRASRRPGVLDRGRRRVRQGPCCRPVLVRSSLRP